MATNSAAAGATAGGSADPLPETEPMPAMAEWLAEAGARGMAADQALALLSMGLLQKLGATGERGWVWTEAEDGGSADLSALRQRLELIQLALQTGAPLSTAEVTALLGARPSAGVVERGGLRARRLSRNVWKLSRAEGSGAQRGEVTSFSGFNDGRRRFA